MNLIEAAAMLCRWAPRRTGEGPLGSSAWEEHTRSRTETLLEWLCRRPEFQLAIVTPPTAAEALPPACRPHAGIVMACAEICGTASEKALQVALLSALQHASVLTDDPRSGPPSSRPELSSGGDFQPAPWRQGLVDAMQGVIGRYGQDSTTMPGLRGGVAPRHDTSSLRPVVQAWVWQCTTPLSRFRLEHVVEQVACLGAGIVDAMILGQERSRDASLGTALRILAARLGSAHLVRQLHELRRTRAMQAPLHDSAWRAEHRAFATACQRAATIHVDAALRAVGALPIDATRRESLRLLCQRARLDIMAALSINDEALMPMSPRGRSMAARFHAGGDRGGLVTPARPDA